ncbi:MAG: hypothetical protein WCO45_05140 [Pseudanabaena sp. ELA607]|jgi:hypothetical protein
MSNVSSARNDWFSTPIWHFLIDNHQVLNQTLLEEIYQEQQRNPAGEQLSNSLGWHSAVNLHKRESF